MKNWKTQFDAEIRYCDTIQDLMQIMREYPQSIIYAILDANLNQKFVQDLEPIKNLRRIILNMNYNYTPRALRNNFRYSNK